jgi:serine/threonine-protein kinase
LEPRQSAFDSAGNVFVADGFGRRFFELPAGGGSAISIPIPASSHGVAVDSADNLYVLTGAIADQSDKSVHPGQVLKVVPEK